MADTRVNSSFLRTENVILLLSIVVLVLSYIASLGYYSHHDAVVMLCCGRDFWWTPLGCGVLLVASSLLFRFRSAYVYPIGILPSLWSLTFSSYIAFQRWIEYSRVNKPYAFQQVLLPIYRPLSILLSIMILSITTRKLLQRVRVINRKSVAKVI